MRQLTKKTYLYPFLAFVFSMLVALYAIYFVYLSQVKYTYSLVDRLADQQAYNLQKVVETDLQFIGAGANFYHATMPEDWRRFPLFADQIISASQTLIALQWMPRVEHHQVSQHIENVRETFPFYQIFTVPKDGPKTLGYILQDKEPIYPASDVYPRSDMNFNALGYYSSRDRFKLVLENIRQSGQPSVSDKIRLLQDGVDRSLAKTGLLVYHPVFSATNQNELLGVVIGVIRSTNYFQSIVIRTATEQDLLVKVTDVGFDAEDDPILYESVGWDTTSGIEISKTVTLPNRKWVVDFKLDHTISDKDQLVLIGIFITAILMASLASYVVLLLVRGQEHLETALGERTAELLYLVDHDTLTGIYNRRAFSRYLSSKVSDNEPFSLVVFDVDRFKLVNDQYGHIAGDEMLCHVARTVQSKLREGDIFVRMGGDEFCIISSITDRFELFNYLQGMGQAVSNSVYDFDGLKIKCSLSIGAAIRCDENEEDIMHASDAQLYKSKKGGRDCVSIAE